MKIKVIALMIGLTLFGSGQIRPAKGQSVVVGCSCLVVGGIFITYSWYWCKTHVPPINNNPTNIIDPSSTYKINFWSGYTTNGLLWGYQGETWGRLNPYTMTTTLPMIAPSVVPGVGFSMQYWVTCDNKPNIAVGTNNVPMGLPGIEQASGSTGVSVTMGQSTLTWTPGAGPDCYGQGNAFDYHGGSAYNWTNSDGDTVTIATSPTHSLTVQKSTDGHNWANLVSQPGSAGSAFILIDTNSSPAALYRVMQSVY